MNRRPQAGPPLLTAVVYRRLRGLGLLSVLSTFTLIVDPASVLLPTTRFAGLIWLIAAAAPLPKTRVARVTG